MRHAEGLAGILMPGVSSTEICELGGEKKYQNPSTDIVAKSQIMKISNFQKLVPDNISLSMENLKTT